VRCARVLTKHQPMPRLRTVEVYLHSTHMFMAWCLINYCYLTVLWDFISYHALGWLQVKDVFFDFLLQLWYVNLHANRVVRNESLVHQTLKTFDTFWNKFISICNEKYSKEQGKVEFVDTVASTVIPGWHKCGTSMKWFQGETEVIREKFTPVPLCLPQIPHKISWDWTWAI
jgi:hypothetical protein